MIKNDNPLNEQIGGDHYKHFTKQPVELFAEYDLNPFQANIIKYIARHEHKNGIEDLQKALHYAELASKLKPNNHYNGDKSIFEYLKEYTDGTMLYDAMYYAVNGDYTTVAMKIALHCL